MLGLDLDKPLTTDEAREAIDSIAGKIVARRLESPAIIFLEMHKPLSFITSQAMLVALPMVGPLIGAERMVAFSKLLADRANIDVLISRIEEMVTQRDLAPTDADNRS